MPLESDSLRRELLEAKISARVAALKVMAARTFVRHHIPMPQRAGLPAGSVARRPRPERQPFLRRGSGGDGYR
jgi:hypothetical protein